MSCGPIWFDARFTFSMKVNSARSFSLIGAVRKSASTASTSGRSPSSVAATAACDPIQKGQSLRREVKAAMSSRIPGDSGEGPRITPCVKADK